MKETPINDIESLLIETITEKPICFNVDGRFFYLYPPSLGVVLLSTNMLKMIQLNHELLAYNEEVEMLRMVHEHKEICLRIIAMHTFRRRSDILYEDILSERIGQFSKIELPALVVLLKAILVWNDAQEKLVKHFNIDKEAIQRKKIADFKNKDRSSVTFGGRSIYGSILDFVSERYGWQIGYTIWGISLTNLNMMMADAPMSMYLTKEERSKIGVSTDKVFINADDPNTAKEIARRFGVKKKGNKTNKNKIKATEKE